MVYSDYKYYNNLDDPENDEDFINGVKEVLKQLNITENINDIKDFVTLMKFINRLMTKHHNDLESVIADTGEPSLLVKSEIYNERHINRQSRDTAQLQKDPAKLVQKIGFKKEPRHYATLCYVPLPGLCTFHEDASRNRIYSILFPRGTSPFIRMVMSNKDELFYDGHAYSKMIDSPFFHAIVKFKWHTFARWYFLTYFIVVVTWFSLLIASSTVDLNKNMEIINLNNDYTDKITIAATKSYMAAVTMIGNLNDATNTFVNNMTIAEASKSNIELITKAISNVAASKIYNVNFTSEINKAAIEAVYNAIIYNTTFTAGISNSTITTINNNYVTEINKAISEIDITAINKLINSTDVVILKLSPPEAFRSLKNFFLEHGYDCISVFQTITIFISVLCIVGYLCLFRNIGLYAYIIMHICRRAICILFLLGILLLNVSYATMRIFATTIPDFDDDKKMYNKNTYDNYIKTSNNVWSGFLNASYDYMYPWDSRYFVSIMRIAFSLFASIIIMNLLIAFVNNVYEEVYKRKYTEWTMFRARAIAYIELTCSVPNNYSFSSFCFINRKNKDYFPPTIIYEANTEEFKKWHDELPNLEKQLFDSTYPI
ncbi:15756_t:CDS:2 [Rhizophagus irregularis]|nr:15756_t:CDS:2 [Rhizophagus irregularis]